MYVLIDAYAGKSETPVSARDVAMVAPVDAVYW